MPATSKSPKPSAPIRATPMHLPKPAPAVVAVVFLISLVMNVAEGGKMARAADGESESLRQVLTNGRPGNLFTLTVNNADLCQSLLETFNRPYSRSNVLSPPTAYYSNLLLKSPLSIEWTLIKNNGVISLSIGRADINNDGQMDWLAEDISLTNLWPGYNEGLYWFVPPSSVRTAKDLDPRINKDAYKIIWGGETGSNFISPINPAEILKVGKYSAAKSLKDKKFIASEIAVVDGTTAYLSTVLPMGDKTSKPWTISVYEMRSHTEGNLLCELTTRNFIQDAIH